MEAPEVARAIAAAVSTASQFDLKVEDTVVLSNSDKLTVRLLPCDVVARVAYAGREVLQFEVDVAQRLAASGSPVATPDPRVAPQAHELDGFVLTFWTYYEPVTGRQARSPVDYATALAQLHDGMRILDVASPHYTDRVAEAQELVAERDRTPKLTAADRAMLGDVLATQRRAIGAHAAREQLLHGEPHPGNLLATDRGFVFIDFETCCRGPVEFDLAHVPEDVSAAYEGIDRQLLLECRHLVLAMVAAWRCDDRDQFPNREDARARLLAALRGGPPWPTLDTVTPPAT